MAQPNTVSDMLVTVKSREVQRATLAQMKQRPEEAKRHFLAAAHLEQVLADDYTQASQFDLARRSMISAASCFWRAGQLVEARSIFDSLKQADPSRQGELDEVESQLAAKYPPSAA